MRINKEIALKKLQNKNKVSSSVDLAEESIEVALIEPPNSKEDENVNEPDDDDIFAMLEDYESTKSLTSTTTKSISGCSNCSNKVIDQLLYDNFSILVCRDCSRKEEDFKLISKSTAIEKYLLTAKQVQGKVFS